MPDDPPADLDEIRALLTHLPGPDLDAGSAAATRERQLTKPAGSLGRLEELAAWLATWQGRHPRRRCARRLGLPRLGDRADGAELYRRRGGGEPAVPDHRRRSAGL